MPPQLHYRACNLCEAICGLEIEHENGRVLRIAGDAQDPFSRGHICPKALGLQDVYEDPDRLRRPQRRTAAGGWEEIGWEQALDEVAAGLRRVQARHGAHAVAWYAGNPSVHNSGTQLAAPGFLRALGSRSLFSASSVDQLPHHFAAWQLYGHPLLLPVPDLDHTDFWLILGGNPLVSNGSLMSAPDVAKRLRAIQERGGRVIVVDPRRTETAARADEHHFIRPGTDVFLLLAMAQVLYAENLVNPGRVGAFTDGLAELGAAVVGFTPESVAAVTGLAPAAIRQLARALAAAERGVVYGRLGVSTQEFGGLCLWLINALNLLTGHLDEPGGYMLATPALDVLGKPGPYTRHNRYRSRVRGLAEFMGELPVAALAEEMLTPGEGQLRALVTSCGNPVLSTPNGRQLDTALAGLEFMVSLDIYRNETTRHAHYILPPATGLETAHYDVSFHALAIRNTSRYAEPLFEKDPEARYDWQIFEGLRQRLEAGPAYDPATAGPPEDPAAKIDLGLRYGPYGRPERGGLSLDVLRENPHGVDLGPLQARLPAALRTANQRINLAAPLFLADLARVRQVLAAGPPAAPNQLLLIGRRELRSNNSWMHNLPRLIKGRNRCTLQLHPLDATARGLVEGQLVRVRSRVGEVAVPVEITAALMPGVASLPHGYGHQRPGTRLAVARAHPGASLNDLTDETRLDALTGNAALSAVPVWVEAAAELA
ncbi:molybdopterin-dependent oxidoreductase [Hymenobacter psychrophilus]|uniref:Anaerobic selenocysteine-containing dehydrogenase n=1 Tax=Hymenobacter psychrophilus TaxID=651662 RepID=A0A1H3LS25_9BACT|nr:molybdopterin-dependent oxidoreductase [Hymenobacter psychrophilus]SDY67181.1 Anaerobic selenocysteine-containing dehydrogenase [Hymenobacter psychrophilus]